jgi:Tol biopolymer transport system component
MRLAIGTFIGTFRILEPLGQGGMGEVYRARDTRLHRDVAVKILPDIFAADPSRMTRFRREAEVLAALNHPNIATIYGIEDCALVMELVDGPTLAEQIKAHPIQLEEALSIARQIAEALEYAHERGVVHRDLKPANIKIKAEGTVKVLDFGLAKVGSLATSEESVGPGEGGTTVTIATQTGAVLGTVPYMAPEQVRGRLVDRRADIWAFGCVLYEMLSGRKAFPGESTSDTLAAILKAEPDWTALPATARPGIVRLLQRCLAKEPKQRMRDFADVRIEITEFEDDAIPTRGSPIIPTDRRPRTRVTPAIALVLALAAFGMGVWWRSRQTRPEAPWSGTRLGGSLVAIGPRIAPDGKLLAFQAMIDATTQVAVMKPESGNWTVLTHDQGRGFVKDISWSNDGTKLYFDRHQGTPLGIFSVPVLGGEERLVLEDAAYPQALPDGSLIIERLTSDRKWQLHRFWPESGRIQSLKALITTNLISPAFRVSRNGNRIIFLGTTLENPAAPDHLYALELNSEKLVRLLPETSIVPTPPFPLAVTADGDSIVFGLVSGDLFQIVSAPSDGSNNLRTLLTPTSTTGYLDIGSDGSVYADQWQRPNHVIRLSASNGTVEHIGESAGFLVSQLSAAPLPDGRIVFGSRIAGRDRLLVTGVGKQPVPLVETQEPTSMPAAPVGSTLVAFVIGERPNQTIGLASIADGRVVRRLTGVRGVEIGSMATLPDGQMIYYTTSGSVWELPVGDGQPKKLQSGNSVTADAIRRELVVRVDERQGVRLVRVPLAGGHEQLIPVEDSVRLPTSPLGNAAMSKGGKMLVTVSPGSSWFNPAALLDCQTGRTQIVNVGYPADMLAPGWTPDGKILLVAQPLISSLWRFQLAKTEK